MQIYELDKSAVLGVESMKTEVEGEVKLLIRLPEKTENASLKVGEKIYYPFTNKEEPYDKRSHCFIIPKAELIASPRLVLQVTSVAKKTKVFPHEGATATVEALYTPETEMTANDYFEATDHGFVPVASKDTDIADGLVYRRITCRDRDGAPLELFLLIADPKRIGFTTAVTDDGLPRPDENGQLVYPIGTVLEKAEQAVGEGLAVRAATNADFFDIYGDFHPAGLCVKNGRILANPDSDRPFFGVLKDGTPVISSLALHPEYKDELDMAVCGSHIVLKDGQPFDLAFPEPFSALRAPRTCVGLRPDGTVVVMVSDGRIPTYSIGTTLVDLALIMRGLGCTDMVNLDGGGSSTVFLRPEGETEFKLENRPADIDRPNDCLIRPLYNGILLYSK
ncbi:MAG: phosphodiester glycosidase family protein [Ruminococcaceae bacterium]|nr:phosphodiester glycosidase family protein [Oscillospiraceae bacterium]